MSNKGLDNKLSELVSNAKNLEKTTSVQIQDILTPEFISQNSNFNDLSELLESSGFKIDSQSDFENIPQNELDTFIDKETTFSSWEDMLSDAGVSWTRKQLGF